MKLNLFKILFINKQIVKFILVFFTFLIFPAVFICACGDKADPYYVVDKVRTPLSQFYYVSATPGSQGCSYANFTPPGGTYGDQLCQQFPLRPGGNNYLKFLVIAPEGHIPTVTLNSVKMFDLNLLNGSSGQGARGVAPSIVAAATDISSMALGQFGFSGAPQINNIQHSPLEIDEVIWRITSLTQAQYAAYANQIQALPGFILSYTTSATNDGHLDSGYMTFFVLPDPAIAAGTGLSWAELQARFTFTPSNLTQAIFLSNLNVPIQINGISPASNTSINANRDNPISASFTPNPIPYSFATGQWYVNSGEVSNDQAVTTNWNPQRSGNVSSVFLMRDLSGGVDYKVGTYSAN